MKAKVIRVIIEEDFMVPIHDDKRTNINGWTIDEVIEDWFKRYGLDSHHATRDSHRIGGARKYISSEVIDLDEM